MVTKRVEQSDSVSYGHTWTASERTTSAPVPIDCGNGSSGV